MGFDENQGKILWEKSVATEDDPSTPIGDVLGRRKFAADTLVWFTKIAQTADTAHAAKRDSYMVEGLERVRKDCEARWKLNTSAAVVAFPLIS